MADAERTYGAPAEPIIDAGRLSRLAVIGDVHGNAVAFAAVLEEIRRDPPDLVVVNGDLLGLEPQEMFALADGLERALFVRGTPSRPSCASGLPTSIRHNWMFELHGAERLAARSGVLPAPSESTSKGSVAYSRATAHRAAIRRSYLGDARGTNASNCSKASNLEVLVTAVHLQFERRVLGTRLA